MPLKLIHVTDLLE